jgi:hypothetical protein
MLINQDFRNNYKKSLDNLCDCSYKSICCNQCLYFIRTWSGSTVSIHVTVTGKMKSDFSFYYKSKFNT